MIISSSRFPVISALTSVDEQITAEAYVHKEAPADPFVREVSAVAYFEAKISADA